MKTKQKKSLKKLPMTGLDYGLLLLFFVIFFFDKLYFNKCPKEQKKIVIKSQIFKIVFCFWVVGLIWSDYGGLWVAFAVGGGGGAVIAC